MSGQTWIIPTFLKIVFIGHDMPRDAANQLTVINFDLNCLKQTVQVVGTDKVAVHKCNEKRRPRGEGAFYSRLIP